MMMELFSHGLDAAIAGSSILASGLIGCWRLFSARSLRTFLLRLAMLCHRLLATTVVAVIALALWRGGFGFFGAGVFLAVSLLIWWTLKTVEAWVDRRDRFLWVMQTYA